MKRSWILGGAVALAAALAPAVSAQSLTTVRVVSGSSAPLYVTHAPGDFGRIFIVEQGSSGTGRIRVATMTTNNTPYTLLPTPFLTISGITTGSERGVLGLAFHPNYNNNGQFFVSYTGAGGTSVVSKYTVSGDPNIANPTGDIILTITQPFANHNGGWIEFGPDGYLYVAIGDGGSSNDPSENAQNLNVLLGKMLRLDVDGDDFPADPNADYSIPPTNPFAGAIPGRDEIWAYGLRNPWRNAFDRLTGELYIADVGQFSWEEVNVQPGSSLGGENYGWDCVEGNACLTNDVGCSCTQPGLTGPVHVYGHTGGHCSVTGGYVYRGCAIPALSGTYFFADYCSAQIWSFVYTGSNNPTVTNRTAQLAPGGGLSITSITSFGEDAYGEMYIVDQNGGEVFKIIPQTMQGADCNANGQSDDCDILAGISQDTNNDGIPDECQCPGDINNDGATDQADLALLLAAYNTCPGDPGYDPSGNIDGSPDGCVSQGDLAILLAAYNCSIP